METPGVVVACPHCGAHLAAPEEPVPGQPQPTALPPQSADSDATASVVGDTKIANASGEENAERPVESDTTAAPVETSTAEETPVWMPPSDSAVSDAAPSVESHEQQSAAPRASVFGTWEPGQAPPFNEDAEDTATLEFDPQIHSGEQAEPPSTGLRLEEPAVDSTSTGAGFPQSEMASSAASPGDPNQTRAVPAQDPVNQTDGVSRGVFIAVLSYASAVTLALIYLLIRMSQPNPHQLESLPDLPPPESNAFHHIREDAQMAPHHTLTIGESRRFGNVRVTPLQVTREPLQLVHYSDRGKSKATSSPVLKLWLEFENESADQTFCPLDLELMLRREYDQENPDRVISNNFVCRASDKVPGGRLVHVYPLNPQDQWDLKDHTAGQDLRPGEKKIVYIPTAEDGVSDLSGDLVWRVHFRKGLNPKSGRGVTTVVEVVFHSDEISSAIHQKPERHETALTLLR